MEFHALAQREAPLVLSLSTTCPEWMWRTTGTKLVRSRHTNRDSVVDKDKTKWRFTLRQA